MATETRRAAMPTSGLGKLLVKGVTAAHAGVYRLSGGRVGAAMGEMQVLLLHTVGARSGAARTNPLAYMRDGDRYVIFGSAGGAARHPAWVHNLRQSEGATVTIGQRRLAVRATEAQGEERARLWGAIVARSPRFADYQAQTSREIPVVVLTPAG